jgi:hypothetical protein
VAIPAPTFPSRDLVRDDEILFRPVDRRRLVAPAPLVVGQGLLLVALLNGGIVIQGGLGAPALRGHPVHQRRVHAPETLEGGILRRDVGHLPGRPLGLGLLDQRVVVAGVEEVAEGVHRGKTSPQEPAEPAVRLEHRDVVEAIAARGEQEDEGLDLLALGVAALAGADVDVLPDHPRQPQRAHRLQD